MNIHHPEVARRNQRIQVLFKRGLSRKQLAYRFRMSYEAIKKAIHYKVHPRARL